MASPLVSVCLTAFNRAQAISKTIESLLCQTLGDFELIIADDASSDGTEQVCRDFAGVDPRIRYIRQTSNIGMPGNLNAAIKLATAPLIANLHDGDLYVPELLAKWKTALDDQPDAAFVFNSYMCLDRNEVPVRTMSVGLPNRFERGDLVRYMLRPDRCFNSPVWGTVMGRASCYKDVGGFDPRFGFVSDVALWLRLNYRFPVAFVNEPLIRLHLREDDRPGAGTNWLLEEAIVAMYREAAIALFPDPVSQSRLLTCMRRNQELRWLIGLGSCFRRERLDRVEEGVRLFRRQDSVVLRSAAIAAGFAAAWLRGSRLARAAVQMLGGMYHSVRHGFRRPATQCGGRRRE